MPDSDKARSKKSYYKKKALGWFKRPFWVHKDDIKDVTAYVDAKANRRKLINSVDDKGEVK